MAVTVVTLCGAGIGTSEILRVSAGRALDRLGIDAAVVATDSAHVREVAADAQVILSTAEHLKDVGPTYAEVIEIDNILDLDELTTKLGAALG